MNRISPEKDKLARDLFLAGHGVGYVAQYVGITKMTAWTRMKRVRFANPNLKCPCGKPAGHNGWCGFRISNSPARIAYQLSQYKDIAAFNTFNIFVPRYERSKIPNERETEIPLLVNRRFVRSLDAPINGYDDETLQNFVTASVETPLEALLRKEEYMTGEPSDRIRRIEEFNRFLERKKSAFYV